MFSPATLGLSEACGERSRTIEWLWAGLFVFHRRIVPV